MLEGWGREKEGTVPRGRPVKYVTPLTPNGHNLGPPTVRYEVPLRRRLGSPIRDRKQSVEVRFLLLIPRPGIVPLSLCGKK